MGEMYLHAKMFCTLTHMSSIPMDAINFYMKERIKYDFYTHVCDVFTCKNVLYTRPYVFYSMDAITFYMQECFKHSPIWLLYPCLQWIYLQECSVHSPVHLLFSLVQCQSLKPVLSQCSQTGFVTVDDFIALYTASYIFYSHGCNKFLHARTIFKLAADRITPILTVLTKVWPCANRAVVTDNSTILTKVSANRNRANPGFPLYV